MTVAIATQTRAEVLTGLKHHSLGERRAGAILAQLNRTPTLPVSEDVVQAYVSLSEAARRVGHAIGQKHHTGDRWIAATAIALNTPLLTGDRVYRDAPGLSLLDVEGTS
jgi:predicted nucleic acid-binding protein